ncbi:Protein of unknown function (DUF3585) [Nesidiocoris tenuis]|uniref:LIM zinc-binding domain-containing protein n=1 Tax=Nesidiocoris tenuis TaxID=355587 RepID=A0ABN7AYE7_9HEMI|nr:Protein of unknown function (DUF3585) [Nesidiocoris tenuis]
MLFNLCSRKEGAPPWRELCVVCTNPVYLAQRLRVQGSLYHRTCFRCARCSAQLTLVDYYETHDGKFCCETCPDEATIGRILPDAIDKMDDEPLPTSPKLSPQPELSPTTRQSIVAMRRMFFDTDDAKLTRSENFRTDLPPADIPKSPKDKVKPRSVNSSPSLVVSNSSGPNPADSSAGPPGVCVEYQSDNTLPSPSITRLDDKSNSSSLNLGEVDIRSQLSPHAENSNELNGSQPVESECSILSGDISKVGLNAQVSPKQNKLDRTIDDDASKTLETIVHPEEPKVKANDVEISSTQDSARAGDFDAKTNEGSSAEKTDDAQNQVSAEELESKPEILVSEPSRTEEPIPEVGINFGEDETQPSATLVEAINKSVKPPPRPKRRQKSPMSEFGDRTADKPTAEYPEDLNPFGDDDEEEQPSAAGTNPFGSDSDDDDNTTAVTSTPLTSPMKTPISKWTPSASPRSERRMSDLSPVRKAPSLNPFEDSDEELEDPRSAMPVPLPRKTTAPSPEPTPFPRSALRASQRSIASNLSTTSSRKKKPAPPPPIASPPSPASTIRSTRSRKSRRAPLPPGMTSSRLSLASDTVSLAGSISVANESSNYPEELSLVADRISEWVETSNLESNTSELTRSVNESSLPVISLTESDVTGFSALDADDSNQFSDERANEINNVKNECHIEIPEASESIAISPSTSPIKRQDPSPSDPKLWDNKNDPIITIEERLKDPDRILDQTSLHDVPLKGEENVKESESKRKSYADSELSINVVEPCDVEVEESHSIVSRKHSDIPPPLEPKISITNRKSYADSDCEDRLSNDKKNKDDLNMTRKISGSSSGSNGASSFSLHKSAHGQWRRKKAPAPPLPLSGSDFRSVKKDLPVLRIKQELNDIEIKQQGLERQGVELEARIRSKFDSDASITPYVEELVLQLFELVNEKNELFRKQAELMYLRRQQHLEEEQADLEKEIRALMSQPEANRTDSDKELEEQLIQRLVEVVERRDAIVQCLEMDRIREAEEDRSISAQRSVFTKAMAPHERLTSPHRKKKPGSVDGSPKKKWYTLGRSPKKAAT